MGTKQVSDARCTGLTLSAPVQLAQDEDKKGEFEITAYTGAPVDRFWGKLVIDVNGIKAAKQMPIFRDHSAGSIVGYSDKNWKVDGNFMVAGRFSEATEAAKEAQALADEGFPWQASIGVRPRKILEVEPGETHEVNGQTVEGPADVWLKSEVLETSFVPLGADNNTGIATFSHFEGEKDMKYTLEDLKEKAPELLESIRSAARQEQESQAATAERKRIQDVLAQHMPGHEELLQGLAFDGKTTGPEAAVAVLAAERKAAAGRQEDFKADGQPPANHSEGGDNKPTDPKTAEEFGKNPELVEEFGDFEAFDAYRKAVGQGLVKTLKKE